MNQWGLNFKSALGNVKGAVTHLDNKSLSRNRGATECVESCSQTKLHFLFTSALSRAVENSQGSPLATHFFFVAFY